MTVYANPEIPTPTSDDPVCQYPNCGIPLTYSGRGRKPKWCDEHKPSKSSSRPASARKSTSDVQKALTILDGMYSGVSAGLMMLSPRAALEWADRVETLQQTNAVTLEGDENLTRMILKAGRGGGKFAFIAAHAFALAPVARIVQEDMNVRAQAKSKTPQPPASKAAPHPGHMGGVPQPAAAATDPKFPGMGFFG